MKKYIGLMLMAAMLTMLFSGCSKQKEVVVYTAVEQVYCEPLFKQFEAETGIKVKAVYDTEANKTTGLVNRIINEADKPVCDVFWNNEFIQTIDLQQKGLLDSFRQELRIFLRPTRMLTATGPLSAAEPE